MSYLDLLIGITISRWTTNDAPPPTSTWWLDGYVNTKQRQPFLFPDHISFYECIKNKWLPSCLSSQKSTNTNINDKAKNTERYIESCWDSGERWDRGVASEQSSSDTLLLSLLLKSIMSVSHFHFKFTEVNASNIHVTFVNQMMDPFWTHSNFHQHASILSSTTKQTSLFSYS